MDDADEAAVDAKATGERNDSGERGPQRKSNDGPQDMGGEDGKAGDEKRSAFRKPWVKALLVIGGLAVLGGGGAYGWYYWTTGRYFQETDNAYIQADQVAVSSQVSGYIASVPVKANQVVTVGQVLATIDDGQYRARLAQQQAQVEARTADVGRVEAELRRQEAQIDQAKAQLAATQVGVRFAADQVRRYKPLAASGADTVEKLDQYRSQLEQNQAQAAVNEAQLQSARKQVDALKAQVEQAKAAVAQAQAGVMQARLDLDHTVIRSSIDGRVGDHTARLGQFVQASTRLMAVVPVEDLYIDANFKETQIGLMRLGQPATVSVDALPDVELHGHVASFSPGTGARFALIPPQNATGNFTKIVQRVPVRIRFKADAEARNVLVSGLSVIRRGIRTPFPG